MTHPDTLQISRAVVEQALEALVHSRSVLNHNNLALQCLPVNAAITALRAALQPPATQAEPVIPAGFALVPIRATAAMVEAFSEEGWEWANVLAAAEAVTEGEYEAALEGTPPATQAALTAASDCRTCQHLSEAWGVCEARPKCVGGEQYVYFPEKQLWDKTPRNDGQAAHQEMREALYAEFNARVQAGTTAPQPDPERDEAARRGASPGTKC